MGEFRDTVQSMCWLLPALGTTYFWVVTLTTFGLRSDKSSGTPSPAPTTGCSEESLRGSLSTSLRLMVVLMVSSLLLLYYIRKVAETAADEMKDDILEDESYKAAREVLRKAIMAVEDAVPTPSSPCKDPFMDAIAKRNAALMTAVGLKPKEGLARLPTRRRRWVRFVTLLVLLCSLLAGLCASIAFYMSLRLQYGCANKALEITPFVVVGLFSVIVHGHAALVACTKD